MKQLTCEMCGSTELIKNDGVFICQTCGCKYSVEEAKKMMIEGNVDVSGSTVKIDNSEMIANYLNMARSAMDSGNSKEAESYANKVIEIEPENAMAWTIKGVAAGWQSTGANNRFSEAVECWKNAVMFVKEKEALIVLGYIYIEGNDIANAIVNMHCNSFINYRSMDNANDILHNFLYIRRCLIESRIPWYACDILRALPKEDKSDEDIAGKSNDQLDEKNEMTKELENFLEGWFDDLDQSVAEKINTAVVSAVDATNADFGPDISDKTDYAYSNWIEEMDCCIYLENRAIDYAQKTKTVEQIYNNIKTLQENVISSCSYSFQVGVYSSGYYKNKSLTNEAISGRREAIKEAEKARNERIAAIKKKMEEKKKELIAEYWEKHPEEKKELEDKKKNLNYQIDELNSQIDELNSQIVPLEQECSEEVKKIIAEKNKDRDVTNLLNKIEVNKEQIEDLKKQKLSLGIFKSKEKKNLQEKIDSLSGELKQTRSLLFTQEQKYTKQIEDTKLSYNSRIDNIQKEIKTLMNDLKSIKEGIEKIDRRL